MRVRTIAKNLLVITAAAGFVFGIFRLTNAGSLTPSASPAGTLNQLSDVYNALVGTFDSSGVTGSKQGDALQVSKCIILKIAGTPCS